MKAHTSLKWSGILLIGGLTTLPVWAQVDTTSCAVRNPMLQGQYTGECRSGWAHGRGVAIGQDRYEGYFVSGYAHGQGIYTWANGQRFSGEFRNGRVNGPAKFYYPNGEVLEGVFQNNRLTGIGTLRRPNGETSLVELQDNQLVASTASASTPTLPVPAQPSVQPSVPGTTVLWEPQLDFDDLFPSYIIATATRKSPTRSQSPESPRGDPLGSIDNTGLYGKSRFSISGKAIPRRIDISRQESYLGDPWGLVGIRLTSPAPGTRVLIEVAIDDIAAPTEEEFVLPSAGAYALYPKIQYRYDRLLAMSQIRPANIAMKVTINGQRTMNRHVTTRIRALRDAPFLALNHRGLERMGWIFASFVTEDAPWLDQLISESFAALPHGALGYQAKPAGVDEQVEVIYNFLKKRGVKYSSITATSGSSQKIISQTVRLPSDAIRSSQANCIDGTVLMASILRKMGIDSFIILGPGHAMLGYSRIPWRDDKDGSALQVVETTMIGSAPFTAALSQGRSTLVEWLKPDKREELQIIDINEVRQQGVTSIAN